MRSIPQLMAEIKLFAGLGLLAGLVLFGVSLWLWIRWRRLEQWVATQARHHERMAEALNESASPESRYSQLIHRWSAKSYGKVLLVMDELSRGRRLAR